MEQKSEVSTEVRQFLMVTRIIVFALVTGVSAFVGFAFVTGPLEAGDKPILWLAMAIFAAMAFVARLLIPAMVFRKHRRQIARGTWQPTSQGNRPLPTTDEGKLLMALQIKTIMGCAILEGAGFANAFAYFSERHVVSLGITLVLILMLIGHFPLRFWLDGWLEQQKRWLDEERSIQASRETT